MPAKPPSTHRYRNRLLRDAAADGMLITLRCGMCGARANFWAADLVRVLGWDHELHLPPFPCSRCRTAEYVSVRASLPSAGERQSLTVRRPVRQVVRWIWRDETG